MSLKLLGHQRDQFVPLILQVVQDRRYRPLYGLERLVPLGKRLLPQELPKPFDPVPVLRVGRQGLLLGLWSYWRNRKRPEARFALVLCGISVLFFCCYFYQGTRFMAAPASVLLAGAVTRIAQWLVGDPSIPIKHEPVLHFAAPRSSRIRREVTMEDEMLARSGEKDKQVGRMDR